MDEVTSFHFHSSWQRSSSLDVNPDEILSGDTEKMYLFSSDVVRKNWYSTGLAKQQLERFKSRYGPSYLHLASHAALPSILTPELLNLIKINFLNKLNIPYYAEADFLLSPLCQQIDDDFYEVEPTIREILLEKLEEDFGLERVQQVAEFLQYFLLRKPDWAQRRDVARAHHWISQAYLEPQKLVHEIFIQLEHSVDTEGQPIRRLADQIQLVALVELVSGQLRRQPENVETRYVLNLSRLLGNLINDPNGKCRQIFKEFIARSVSESAASDKTSPFSPIILHNFVNQPTLPSPAEVVEVTERPPDIQTSNSRTSSLAHCDILIIVPLREEFEILTTCCQVDFLEKHDAVYYYALSLPGCSYQIRCLFIDRTGPTPAGVIADKAINHCNPRLVVLIGIGGALDNNLLLGDVVVGDAINEYQADHKDTQEAGQDVSVLAGRYWSLPIRWINSISHLPGTDKRTYETWQQEIGKIKKELHFTARQLKLTHDLPRVDIGPIASGNIVGASRSFAKKLLGINRKFRVVEMEAAGVAEACHNRDEELDLIVIRGISDFSDERKSKLDNIKNGAFRRLAMVSASKLFLSALYSNNFQEILPCQAGDSTREAAALPEESSEGKQPPSPAQGERESPPEYLKRPDWFKKNGYRYDPFPKAASRAEADPILNFSGQEIFVDPPGIDYEGLLECLIDPSPGPDSFFVYGKPGTGKSTLRKQFARDVLDRTSKERGLKILVVDYSDHNYNNTPKEISLDEHINRILRIAYDQESLSDQDKSYLEQVRNPVRRLGELRDILTRKFAYQSLVILLDNVDAQRSASPQKLAGKVSALLTNTDIYNLKGVRFACFLPVFMREDLQKVTPPLVPEHEISWSGYPGNGEKKLKEMLQLRLRACLNEEDHDLRYSTVNLADICRPELRDIEDRLVAWGSYTGQPREMWNLGYQLIEEHFNSSPFDYRRSKTDFISIETYSKVFEKVESFYHRK